LRSKSGSLKIRMDADFYARRVVYPAPLAFIHLVLGELRTIIRVL